MRTQETIYGQLVIAVIFGVPQLHPRNAPEKPVAVWTCRSCSRDEAVKYSREFRDKNSDICRSHMVRFNWTPHAENLNSEVAE